MKWNWVSPLPPAATDIANYTARILPELAQAAEVSLWADQERWDSPAAAVKEVCQLTSSPETRAELQLADLTFYNMGNNGEFHTRIWETSRSAPGIVVLHEIRLQDFFAEYYLEKTKQRETWVIEMRRCYGRAGLLAASAFLRGACDMETVAARFPMTELAVRDAIGVVVHNPVAEQKLTASLACPVAFAPLPYRVTTGAELERWRSIRKARKSPPWNLVSFGFFNTNRRIRAILEALAGLSVKDQFRLRLCGAPVGPEDITAMIREYHLEDRVTWHGFVEDLDGFLADADLAINLRNPTMGEASGSQLRIWDHALPSFVTRGGWYASLPADCVRFIDPANEIDDVRGSLVEFLKHPEAFRESGRRGRAHLEAHHQPVSYVATLLALATEALKFQPRAAALLLAERAGAAVRPWSASMLEEDMDRVSRAISSLANGTRKR